MGFDPECILQPELVPGEYYCPLCRQLVHPAEVQQTHCGHLFCRPCVQYIIATTRCCPYENHPISEGDPKNLQETNPAVFDAIGRIGVRCLFYKSGCVWQGLLSESAAHSSGCAYGNSPVYCNRCGVQILHKQVQEHAQTCNMVQSQPQAQAQPQPQAQQAQAQQQTATQAQVQVQPHAQPQPQSQAPGQPAAQAPTSMQPQSQAQHQAQAYPYPTADQWYQQQYQQYYNQQYEQYQQQYQQYEQYQQQQQQQQHVQQAPMSNGQPYPVQQPTAAMHQQAQMHPPQMQAAQMHPPAPHLQHQPHPQHPYPQQAQTHSQHAAAQQLPGQPQQYPSQPQTQPHVHPQQQVPPFQQSQPHSHTPHPHPQNPFQAQPHPQMQAQVPPQQAYQGVPHQHMPGPHSQQQSPWEQQSHPGNVGWTPDGSRQVVQDPNSLPQYPSQHPTQNTPHWQSKNLPGQTVHPTAPHSQPYAMQPWLNAHMQPNNQPGRPSALHAPTSQSLMHAHQTQKPAQNLNGLPRAQADKITQPANLHASMTQLDNKTNHVTAVDGAKSATEAIDSDMTRKSDNQHDDKQPGTDNSFVESNQQSNEKNVGQQDANVEGTDPKSSNENVQSPSGQESKQVQDPGQVQQKETQLQQGQNTPQKQSNYNASSLPPQHKNPQMLQGVPQTFSQPSGQIPRPIPQQVHQQSPYHQSPNKRQDAVMPQMAVVQRPRAPFHPPSYPQAGNPGQKPPADGIVGMPPYGNPRPGPYPDQKMPLPGQGGPQSQPPHWRPSGPGGFPFESQSPSHAPSPLGTSVLPGGAQRSYPDHYNQSFMPPPPHMHGARPSSVEHNRHLMEQIAAFENETKGSKPTEGEKFSGARSDESFFIERGHQRSMFRPELGGRDRSPSKAATDIYPRFPPGSSLDMPHRGPHHASDMELGGRPGIPPEISAGREYMGRPGFLNDVPGARDFTGEFGHSRKPGEFSMESAAHLKYQSDAFRRGMSPEFASRAGPLPDIGSRRTPPRPPFHLESDSRPKYPLDADGPPFHIDGDSRSRFPEMDSRPSYLLNSDSRPKFPDSEMSRPSFHLDAHSRSRFPAENERTGLHPDIEQRSKFALERERPRFDSDIDGRRNFEPRSGFPFEERSRATGFSSEIGRFSGPHQDIMGGRPDGLGLPSEFLGPRGDNPRNRADTIPSIRSPGRDPAGRRDSFSSGWREPYGAAGHFDTLHGPGAMHGGPELGRDAYRFEDPRMKGLDLHPNPLLHEPLNPGRPFHHVGRPHHPGGPGPGFAHGFGMPRPPLGFMNGGPFFKPDMDNDFGRKRKQSGSLGWCRICRVDCYTVQGLEEHSKSEEHQKKTLEMVMSIKQDTAKKHKNTNPPEHTKDSPKSTSEKREKSTKSDEDEVPTKEEAE